jgi:hypothetical protein
VGVIVDNKGEWRPRETAHLLLISIYIRVCVI